MISIYCTKALESSIPSGIISAGIALVSIVLGFFGNVYINRKKQLFDSKVEADKAIKDYLFKYVATDVISLIDSELVVMQEIAFNPGFTHKLESSLSYQSKISCIKSSIGMFGDKKLLEAYDEFIFLRGELLNVAIHKEGSPTEKLTKAESIASALKRDLLASILNYTKAKP